MNLDLILMSENDIAEFKKNVQCAFQKGFEVAELINLPLEEKTVILYKNKKTSITHQFKYKVKKSINRRGEK